MQPLARSQYGSVVDIKCETFNFIDSGLKSGMAKDRSKIVLCVANDSVCLCQVADQKGRAFILSSQVVQAEYFGQNKENWLEQALKIFRPKLLKNVTDVLVSAALTHYIPLEVLYLREENFTKTTLLELEHSLGNKISQFKFGIYRTEKNNIAHVFLAPKPVVTKLSAVLESAGIRKPRILLSPVMFIEESKRQVVNTDTVFLDVGRNLIALVLCKKTEVTVRLLPIKWDMLVKEISQIVNQNCSEEGIYQLIQNAQKQKLNPPIQYALDEFFEALYREISQHVDQYFGTNGSLAWVVGGCHNQLYGIRQRIEKKMKQKIIPYSIAFKQQISPSIGADIMAIMEPFLPGLLTTATLEKKQLDEVINLQTDTVIAKAKTEESFFYQKFVTGLACIASVLLYFSQYLRCRHITSEVRNRELLAEQDEMVRIAKQIEDINGHIRERKKLLGNVLVYIEQNRKWCELFNALQNILTEVGDVYLTSFVWNTQTAKAGDSSPQKTQKTPLTKEINEIKEKAIAPSNITATIAMTGNMFISDVEITKDVEREFNVKFNAIFDKIRQLPFCAGLSDIKVNVPENATITFRCTMKVNPKSKIMAL
ncbi:MAG: hypothetical protein LBB05_02315 [Puniceicoccales bacterium]|nr:hypothetical protein [Puniceicoccales bacterium]